MEEVCNSLKEEMKILNCFVLNINLLVLLEDYLDKLIDCAFINKNNFS